MTKDEAVRARNSGRAERTAFYERSKSTTKQTMALVKPNDLCILVALARQGMSWSWELGIPQNERTDALRRAFLALEEQQQDWVKRSDEDWQAYVRNFTESDE